MNIYIGVYHPNVFEGAMPFEGSVPITIDGSWKLLRFNLLPVPFGTRIRIRIDPPIARSEGEDRLAMLGEIREQIANTLVSWRASSATQSVTSSTG